MCPCQGVGGGACGPLSFSCRLSIKTHVVGLPPKEKGRLAVGQPKNKSLVVKKKQNKNFLNCKKEKKERKPGGNDDMKLEGDAAFFIETQVRGLWIFNTGQTQSPLQSPIYFCCHPHRCPAAP